MKHYLGIDLGGTNIVAGVINEQFEIISQVSTPTLKERSFEEIVADMAKAAKKAVEEAGISPEEIPYVGIGAPSNIHPESMNVIFANNLRWVNMDLAGEFKKHWSLPVYVGNDADLAALGEILAGAAKGYKDALMITIGTGIGSGLIIDGQIYQGGNGFGCEFGHSLLIHDGFPCNCGNRGCIESYVSITGLIRETISHMEMYRDSLMWELCGRDLNKVNGRTSFEAAKQGDPAAVMVYENFIAYLSSGLTSFINMLRPSVVIIGGGISREGDYLLEPVRKQVLGKLFAVDVITPPPIIRATLGGEAGLVGAAFLKR